MKYLKMFENFYLKDYLAQSYTNEFVEITSELYELICEEGFVSDLENYYGQTYGQINFEYTMLNLLEEDKRGLMNLDENILNKFNQFDLELKKQQGTKYPTICDFIDYDRGIVYIIKLI